MVVDKYHYTDTEIRVQYKAHIRTSTQSYCQIKIISCIIFSSMFSNTLFQETILNEMTGNYLGSKAEF